MEKYTLVLGAVFSACGFAVALIFNSLAAGRKKRAENESEGKQSGIVLTEIGYIKSGIDSITRKIEMQDNRFVAFVERLAQVESSVKQAHKRIDEQQERSK